ncbi:MAG: hypothetical protein QNJ87_03890 [Gammaproteobacteria bacterium]|nr:hypothetical protein [Gammaproteobacteria bacterium]MDJ0893255.1 hypothetical protein [Gammaproteobacteria bacterium]
MDRKKVFFIVLAIFAVLYFASLGTGIWLNAGDEPNNPSQATDKWVGALGPLLSVFAPALDLTGLECQGNPVNNKFTLVFKPDEAEGGDDRTCDIRIPPDGDKDYRKAELITKHASVDVYVRAKFERKRFKPQNRADNCLLDATTVPEPIRKFTPIREGEKKLETDELPGGPRLEVWYPPPKEGDQDPKMWECWLKKKAKEPVPITAFEEGGTLRLAVACDDCKKKPRRSTAGDENKPVVVTLQME